MKFGIIGSGGREHAICYSLKKNSNNQVYCFPGNAGTENIATNIDIDLNLYLSFYLLQLNLFFLQSTMENTEIVFHFVYLKNNLFVC